MPLFRDLWLASIVSNLGGWMQDTAGTWLMTVLTTSPLLIALMQTAASLPVVILGLLAGATADIFDRRRLLIFWQAWMLTAVAILSVLTFFDIISPWILLILTFLLNIGTAMNSPAWQAIVPEVIPRAQLPGCHLPQQRRIQPRPRPGTRPGRPGDCAVRPCHYRRCLGVPAQFPFLRGRDPGFVSLAAQPAVQKRTAGRADTRFGARGYSLCPLCSDAAGRLYAYAHLHPLRERRLGPAGRGGP